MSMKSSELHKLWDAPDNSRLTSKQLSFRLPVHVAAKLAALCELYPRKSRTEIVGDLMATVIDEVAAGLPYSEDQQMRDRLKDQYGVDGIDDREFLYGPREDFRRAANKHYQELEKELGNDAPGVIYQGYRAE